MDVQDRDAGANSTPRTVYFFLIDTTGKEHLAAVGEALGKSSKHEFSYKFTGAFRQRYGPETPLYNRHNVREWLLTLIRQSASSVPGIMGNTAGHSRSGDGGTYIKHDHAYASLATPPSPYLL